MHLGVPEVANESAKFAGLAVVRGCREHRLDGVLAVDSGCCDATAANSDRSTVTAVGRPRAKPTSIGVVG